MQEQSQDIVKELNELKSKLLAMDGESLLSASENTSAYLETFSRRPLEANLIAQALDQNRRQVKFDSWVVSELERVALRNEAMVRCNYLSPEIVEQTADKQFENPSYKIFSSEQEYIDAYNHEADTFSFDFFTASKHVRDLDRFVSNTVVYLEECSKFDLFIKLLQKQPLEEAEHQTYLNNFIKPIEDVIKRYEAAKTMEDKISAYKQISAPLRALSTEMYQRAVTVYPECYQPTWLRTAITAQQKPQ